MVPTITWIESTEFSFPLEDTGHNPDGFSKHAHRKLREMLDTPILQTEHVRGLEPHTDFIANDATDFVRADPEYDAGITGAMKIVRWRKASASTWSFTLPTPPSATAWPPRATRATTNSRSFTRTSEPHRTGIRGRVLRRHGCHRRRGDDAGAERPRSWRRVRLELHREEQHGKRPRLRVNLGERERPPTEISGGEGDQLRYS